MDLLNIRVNNFLIIGQADINLSNRGLCRIAGENSDDVTSSSNGAGKSSIIEAIYWCLFGETLRNIKSADGVVNRKVKKNCSVVLDFKEEENVYRIERYRKHSKHKNNLYLYINDVDSRGKDNRETQGYIESLIGMDKMSFANSVLFGQGHSKNLKRFSEMTDSEKKGTLENILNLEVFGKSHELVKDNLKALEVSREEAIRRAKELSDRVVACEERLTGAVQKATKFDEEKVTELLSLKDQKKEIEETVLGLRKRMDSLDYGGREEIEELIESGEDLLAAEVTAKSKLSDAFMERRNEKLLIKRSIERDIKVFQEKISQLFSPESVGETCEKCGNLVTEEMLVHIKDGHEFNIEDMKRSTVTVQGKIDSLADLYKEKALLIEDRINEVKEFIFSQKKVLQNIMNIKNKHLALSYQLDAMEERAKTYESAIVKAQSTENVWKGAAESYGEELIALTERVDEFEKEVEAMDIEISYYKFWKTAFSRTGIRSYLLDQIVPFLNERVGHYLDILTDGGIEAAFHTVKELASGEKRENFNLEIINRNAADSYEGNSGGEKRRIDLGVALGFNDFLAARSGKRFNLLLLDEVFEGVDADGLYYVIKVLEDIARRKSSVFVISHRDELKSYFSDEIMIKRVDGLSYVAGE